MPWISRLNIGEPLDEIVKLSEWWTVRMEYYKELTTNQKIAVTALLTMQWGSFLGWDIKYDGFVLNVEFGAVSKTVTARRIEGWEEHSQAS